VPPHLRSRARYDFQFLIRRNEKQLKLTAIISVQLL
jgi:hypothetical protein